MPGLLDPNLGQTLVTNLAPLGQGIERGVRSFVGRRDQEQALQRQQDRQTLIGNLSEEALAGSQTALTRLSSQDPQVANTVVRIIQSNDTQAANQFQQLANRAGNLAASVIQADNPAIGRQLYMEEGVKFKQEGDEASAAESFRLADLSQTNPDQFRAELEKDMFGAEDSNLLFRTVGMGSEAAGAGQREFESLISGFAPGEQEEARRVKAGLAPRAMGSAVSTLAAQGSEAVQAVADVEQAIAGAKEKGKLTQQLFFKPQITKAVKLAEKEATARGETLTDLARSQAAMPGLREAVSQLKALAPIATSTLGGRAFDVAIKESGFGSTKGSNARAKFIAIINNQVLPLLKQTFGAAFTEREGETLKATMGDPNATPEQKLLQLDAFISQKERDIESKQRELGQDEAGPSKEDETLDLSTLTMEQLIQMRQKAAK